MPKRPPTRALQITAGMITAFTLATGAFAQSGSSIVETIRALLDKGNVCLAKQQFSQAIECYQKVLDQEPNNPYARSNMVLAHNNWGIFWFHKNNFEEAKTEWEKTLKLDPNDRNAKNNLVVLRRTLERMGKNFDDLGSEAKAKEEEKKKAQAKADQPPSAVLLTPQKRIGGVDSYDENDLKQGEAPSGASLAAPQNEAGNPPAQASSGASLITPHAQTGNTASQASSGASLITPQSSTSNSQSAGGAAPASPSAEAPMQPGPEPVNAAQAQTPASLAKTKADEQLDAFRRLTTSGNTASGATNTRPTQPPALPFLPSRPYSGGKPVFHASTGSPSFEDDLPPGQPAASNAPADNQNQTGQPQGRSEANQDRSNQDKANQNRSGSDRGRSGEGEQQSSTALSDTEEKSHKHKKPPKQVAQVEPWHSSNDAPAPPSNIDDLLNRIEIKVYGQPRPQPSVLLRLERIETDSFGHPSNGSIAERILKLKQMYNLL